jgi:hypothetical protein
MNAFDAFYGFASYVSTLNFNILAIDRCPGGQYRYDARTKQDAYCQITSWNFRELSKKSVTESRTTSTG